MNWPEALALLDNTAHTQNPDIFADSNDTWTTATVMMDDGSQLEGVWGRQRGIWNNSLNRDERLVKVRACASRMVAQSEVGKLIESAENLEEADAGGIVSLCGMLGGAD